MAAVAPTPYLVQQLIHADSEAEDVNLLGVLLVVVHLWRHVHEGAGAPTHEPLGLCGQLNSTGRQYRVIGESGSHGVQLCFPPEAGWWRSSGS